jgi:hypothetical protein
MRSAFPLLLLGLVAGVAWCAVAGAAVPTIHVVSGVTEEGKATDLWLAVLRRRLAAGEYDAIAGLQRPLTPEEKAWADLIRSRVPQWSTAIPALVAIFEPIAAPDSVVIVLGNRGAEDAFTHDPTTIGFDLAALQRAYGSAANPQNEIRLLNIFRHEFTHLLQKRWLPQHPWSTATPLQAALLNIWTEGLGNYYSLSDRWQPAEGRPSPAAAIALAELEPRFVARLAALSCSDPTVAPSLMAELSSGPFDRKWGALPIALWLAAEHESADAAALRRFVTNGPGGIWELADRHLPSVLAAALRETRQAAQRCAG